jgi:hypothetical protein
MSIRLVLTVVLVATLTAAANADFVLVDASRSVTAYAAAPLQLDDDPDALSEDPGLWQRAARKQGIAYDFVLPYGNLVIEATAIQNSLIPASGTQISGRGEVYLDVYRDLDADDGVTFEGFNARVASILDTTFSLSEPHAVELTGSISSTSSLYPFGDFVFYADSSGDVLTHMTGINPISYVGVLPPGQYSIFASVQEFAGGEPVSFGDQQTAYWDFTLNLTPIPEPASASLLALAAPLLTRRRQRR